MSKIREQNIGQILIDQYEPEGPAAEDQNHSRLHLKKKIAIAANNSLRVLRGLRLTI